MVAGIDNWLFRWADKKECEPEIENDNVSCTKCLNKTCEYFDEFHSEVKNS